MPRFGFLRSTPVPCRIKQLPDLHSNGISYVLQPGNGWSVDPPFNQADKINGIPRLLCQLFLGKTGRAAETSYVPAQHSIEVRHCKSLKELSFQLTLS